MVRRLGVYGAVAAMVALVMALAACGSREVIKEVPVEVVVEREVIREVQVPGKTVVVEKEVVKEVQVPGETIVVEKEVVREVQVPGETVVVEKEVVKEVPVEVVVEREVVKVVEVPVEVVVEKEVVREVEKMVVVEVVKEVEVSTPSTSPAPTTKSGGTPPATTFQDYQRERFVSAAQDAVSTFSLDTDRTSYYLALNWARTGYKVEPDSVRAEEWINAFDYQYEAPADAPRST